MIYTLTFSYLDIRDEKLSEIMTGFQSYIRWYLGLADRRRRMQQRAGLLIIQRNVRSWCTLRTWPWFKLYGCVKPLLKSGKEAEELEKVAGRIKELEDALAKEESLRKELEENNSKLVEEKNGLFQNLESTKTNLSETENKLSSLQTQKSDLDR